MSPIPKANEPGNNPQSTKEAEDELEPPPQDYNSVLNAGDMSSEEEDSDDGGGAETGGDSQYGGYQLLMQDQEHADDENEAEGEDDEETASAQPQTSAATGNLDDELEQDLPHAHFQYSETCTTTDPTKPNLPIHLAKLLPSATPVQDAASQDMHTDTGLTLEQRKERMAADDQIRAAMAGISLPTAAIPTWARAVDESNWKEQLVARIQCKHETQQLRTGNAAQVKGTGTKR